MTISRFALAVVGLSLAAAPALAQNAQSNMPASNNAAKMDSTSAGATINYMSEMKSGEWRASKLRGVNVYNNSNEKIGDINEILIDSSGKIEAVVIGVGGFLGMGEHDVAVPFNQLRPVMQPVQTSSAATSRPAGDTPTSAANNTAATAPRSTSNDVTGTVSNANDRGYPDHFLLNATKDQLKAAPQFKYSASNTNSNTNTTR